MKRILALTLVLLAVTSSMATTFHTTHLSVGDILRASQVRRMTQDPVGFIWMGTDHGLYRYDGYTMHQVHPRTAAEAARYSEAFIHHVSMWGDRYLLLRLRGNVYVCYDLQEGRYVDFVHGADAGDDYKRCTIVDAQELWLWDEHSGCRWVRREGTTFTSRKLTAKQRLLASDKVNFIAGNAQEGYWIGTAAGVTHWRRGFRGIHCQGLNIVASADAGRQGLYLFSDRGDLFVAKGGRLLRLRTADGTQPTIRKAAYHQGRIFITTLGPTYEYDLRSHQLRPSTTIPLRAATLVEDNHHNPVIFDGNGQDVYYLMPNHIYTFHGIYSAALNHSTTGGRFQFISGSNGLLWVSTYGNGLFCYNTHTGELSHLTNTFQGTTPPLASNYLLGIYADRDNKIWAIEEYTGVSIITPDDGSSRYLYFTAADDNTHANAIRLLRRIGSEVFMANMSRGMKVSSDLHHWQDVNGLDDDVVDIAKAPDGQLWMGTRHSGIYVGSRNYRHDDHDARSLARNKISSIVFDHKGRAWISLFDAGVDMAERQADGTLRFRHFFTGKHAVNSPRTLLVDHRGYLWLCSSEGVYRFSPDELLARPDRYERYPLTKEGGYVECHAIIEDSRHHVWIGTNGLGLFVFENDGQEPRQLRVLTEDNGLANNYVQALVEDRSHNIWASTANGLCCINGRDYYAEAFYPGQTDLENSFSEGAALLLPDGRLAFGSYQGIAVMDLRQRHAEASPYSLVISGLDINGVQHASLEDDPIDGRITGKKEIRLSHQQNSLTLYVTDFEGHGRYSSRYSYYFEGADRGWSPLSEDNKVTYKNLAPGTYTFHVRAYSNRRAGGIKETTLRIVIAPPLWATWWAYLIYIALATAIGYYLYRNLRHIEALRNRIRVEKELAVMKDRFFANMSHEFRTPLTLIRGALDNIRTRHAVPGDMREPMETLDKSVSRMRRLIDQLLEFHKMENGHLHLSLRQVDLVTFCRDIFYTFSIQAQNKGINYQLVPFAPHETAFVDTNFLDHILFNLLSNAFKYTPQKEAITMRIAHRDGSYVISVEDTGIGVNAEMREQLFKRFNQSTFVVDSMGIGLELSAGLAHTHHGGISYEPNGEKGSIFALTLPDSKDVYQPADFLAEKDHALLKEEKVEATAPKEEYRAMTFEPMNDCHVWIAEDDEGIRQLLQRELQTYFQVTVYADGDALWTALQQAADDERPQLIVTDAMMPVMDGFHLVKKVRADKALATTPIIMLTALANDQQAVKGLNAGADAYVTKPFSVPVLIAQCSMLLRQRTKLKADYSRVKGQPRHELKAIITEEDDRKLKDLIDAFINGHIDDEKLNIDAFAASMNLGRTNFYRKMKALTGMTPNEYVRKARMERAAELLRDRTLTISQVAYKVGIADAYYFSKTFKTYFGITPSQYRKGDHPA